MDNQSLPTIPHPVPEPILTSNQVEVVETKPKSSPVVLILLIILAVLLAASTVFLYYQNMQLKNTIASYQSQTSITPTSNSQSPFPTLDPTTNWKTYTGKLFTFKYPSDWVKNGEFELKGQNQTMRIVIAEEGSMMNECMKEGPTETRSGFIVRNFTSDNTGEMCSGGDLTKLESWVVKDVSSYGPGIQIFYNSGQSGHPLPNEIIADILSTFKFTN